MFVLSFRRNEAFFPDKLRVTACANGGRYLKVLGYADIDAALQEIVQVYMIGIVGTDRARKYRSLIG